MHITTTEHFADLIHCNSVTDWRNLIFKLANDLGYEQTILAIFPDQNTPLEPELAFLHSNYSSAWRNRYDAQKLWYIDPAVTHCTYKSIPQLWSPNIFYSKRQKAMYEEACSYGLRSGVTLPIHGTHGEMGILCFVTDTKPGKSFQREANNMLPELSYFRDFIFETSRRFMRPSDSTELISPLTRSELECLRWCAKGKSSGDIAQILNCSIATINFHFAGLRRKFRVSSRHQVVVKAIRHGLIYS